MRQRISRARTILREQVATMVQSTIARTKPGKAFTTAVIAAVATAYSRLARPKAPAVADAPSPQAQAQPSERQANPVLSTTPANPQNPPAVTVASQPVAAPPERNRIRPAAIAPTQPADTRPAGVLSGRITDIDTGEPVRNAVVRIPSRPQSAQTLPSYARTGNQPAITRIRLQEQRKDTDRPRPGDGRDIVPSRPPGRHSPG